MCKYFALQGPPSTWKVPRRSYSRYPARVFPVRTLVTRTVIGQQLPLAPLLPMDFIPHWLQHTLSISYAICCNFRFRLGWPSSMVERPAVCKCECVLSRTCSCGFTGPSVLCYIPQITDTHILYWARIKGHISRAQSIPSRPASTCLPFPGYLVHFVALLINGNLCIMRRTTARPSQPIHSCKLWAVSEMWKFANESEKLVLAQWESI